MSNNLELRRWAFTVVMLRTTSNLDDYKTINGAQMFLCILSPIAIKT